MGFRGAKERVLGKRIEWEGKVKGRNLDEQWNKTHFMTTYAKGMKDKAGMSKIRGVR